MQQDENGKRPVVDYDINKKISLGKLGKQLEASGGFTAKKIGTGTQILKNMFEDDCIRLLSFPACIISTGTRGLIKELIKRKMFDIVITTCGTLDHDFARCYADYYHGHFEADDNVLHKKGINRLGNIFIPNSSYGEAIENNLQPILKDIYNAGKKELSTHELCWEIGSRLEGKKKEESILYWLAKNKIPCIIPGITDGAFGMQILLFKQDHPDFNVDIFRDEQFLLDKMFNDVKSGALMLGGGISKHHVIWWNQFKGGLDYAVYVTTAPEWDGSLSGARMREAVSWGKVREDAKFINIEGDVTVILPLLLGPLL